MCCLRLPASKTTGTLRRRVQELSDPSRGQFQTWWRDRQSAVTPPPRPPGEARRFRRLCGENGGRGRGRGGRGGGARRTDMERREGEVGVEGGERE